MKNENENLQTNILQELKKTGFPTEVISADIMQRCGWGVLHSPSYWDESEKTSREFDLRAFKNWKYTTKGGDFSIGVYLIVECKKSEKPWVFFSTPENHSARTSQFVKAKDKFIFTNVYRSDSQISDETLRKFHHYFNGTEMARTFYEPFKGQEKSDASQMIYSAIMSSVKATLFHLQERANDKFTSIYYPVIVFNGNMYNARVKSIDDIELMPSEHIQLSFNYMLPKSVERSSIWEQQERFIIDVVHYEHLEKFLSVIEKEHTEMAQLIQDSLNDESN